MRGVSGGGAEMFVNCRDEGVSGGGAEMFVNHCCDEGGERGRGRNVCEPLS